MKRTLAASLTLLFSLSLLAAPEPPSKPDDKSIASKIAKLQKLDGFIPLYWDDENGKLLLEITRFNEEFLYQISLPAGVGSNPIGLDRGQSGDTRIVFFERVGPKVFLTQPNYRFRAISSDATERRAVEESFARSIIHGFKVEAREGSRVLVDATPFFLRDAHGVSARLRESEQGSYSLDESRSAIYMQRTKAFPKNTEIETQLTFASTDRAGSLLRSIAPNPQVITIRQHHSFVELPPPGYVPRKLDPRVGVFGIEFYDYASPIAADLETRWISRHRLEKKDPSAAISDPVRPIVYYVDPGAPEPIRSALVEGAAWWNQAFEAAGFRNAFQVRVLPPDADPMDIRYNMINWVHRSTRGWSYGGGVIDPRTGEILKGNVLLGSLRIRQDYMLATGMIPLFEGEEGPTLDAVAALDPSVNPIAMALARIRQLSAHEVGHTLGLDHNFAASTYGRGSVMDYPAPWVGITNGKLDLSNAYSTGIGAYDKFAIRFAYSQFPPGASDSVELEKIIRKGVSEGMLFIGDDDARPLASAHPLASLWDNGADPLEALRHEMEVRRIALEQFGLATVPSGTPLSLLEAKLLPLYLHHRYQLEAAAKSVGGMSFTYAVKSGNGANPKQVREIVPAARQREALSLILKSVDSDFLLLPQRIVDLIPPRAYGYEGGTAEYFSRRTDPAFDPVSAATVAADIAITPLLDPKRAARLNMFHAENRDNPDFAEVAGSIVESIWAGVAAKEDSRGAITRAVQRLLVSRLMQLAENASADPVVTAVASDTLRKLSVRLKTGTSVTDTDAAHRRAVREDIERFLNRPLAPRKEPELLPIPAGAPIGG